VGSSQLEIRQTMVELSRAPAQGSMADRAICAEIAGHVVRIGRGLVGGLMTGVADSARLVVSRAGLMTDTTTADIMTTR
jgi:hypothetical protein